MAFPNSKIDEQLNGEFVAVTVDSLLQLSQMGIPKNVDDLKIRIDSYFRFCVEHEMRPSIECLCLSLGTTRQNFWNWCNGAYRDDEWQQVCVQARQIIISFLECSHISGKLNPASAIFLLKNWAGYTDSVQIETAISQTAKALSATDLPSLERGDGGDGD